MAGIVVTSILGSVKGAVVDVILFALSLIVVVRSGNAVESTGATAVVAIATAMPGLRMAWIVTIAMIEEGIFISLINLVVVESGDIVEATGNAILLTITIARVVSRIVATIVESVFLGLIRLCIFSSFITIEEGVSVLVMERSVIVVMGKSNTTRILVAIVAVTGATPGDSILFGFAILSDSILLLLFIIGIVIEGGVAFEVGMAVVVVVAVSDSRSIAMLVIVEGIFLGSLVVIEVAGMRTS